MSGVSSFPDVTLAEQKPLTPAGEKSEAEAGSLVDLPESNHVVQPEARDTVVILRHRAAGGVFFSRGKIVFVLVLAVLILTIFVLLTAFVTWEFCNLEQLTKDSTLGKLHAPDEGSGENTSFELDHHHSLDDLYSELRLPRELIPSHYDLELKINLNTFLFNGSVNMTLHVNGSTRKVIFHRGDIFLNESMVTVRSQITGHLWRVIKQKHNTAKQYHILELDRDLPAGLIFKVEIGQFSGKINNDLKGLYQSSYKTRDGTVKYVASSQLQSTDARRVFPCFDEPDFKATFSISMVHQKEYRAFSNMPVQRETRLDDYWVRKEFETTPIMSTYILAFVVGDFVSRNETIPEKSGRNYQIKVWARPEAYPQTEHALTFAVKTYNFFANYFDIPDSVPKADHVAVPDFSAGAMENWGLVIYRETALLFDPRVSSSSNKYMVSLIVAHEISHTWFGNMATMRWWDDLWLNEGFASSLMYIAMDYVYPDWNVFAIQVVEDIFTVMVKDALVTSHPLVPDIKDPEEISQFFDPISYNKGMAVLRMLRHFIGPENFRKGLQSYIKKYQYKNAVMSELWQTFTEVVQHEFVVSEIMDTWTRQMGYPMVTVTDAGSSYLLSQQRFLLHDNNSSNFNCSDSPYGYKWIIPFTYITENNSNNSRLKWLNKGSAEIPKNSSGWLLGNFEYHGFYRVMYEKPMWARLANQLMTNHKVFPEASRAGLIGDAFSFSRANLLDYDITLNLTRYLKNEKSYVPWRAFLDSMEFLRGMIAAEEAYVHLQEYLKNLVRPLFDSRESADEGSLPERYLKRVILSIACDVGLEEAVTYAKSMFSSWMQYGNTPAADYSMSVYSVGVREGGVKEWEFVWNKSRNTTVASEREMMMEALAQTQKPFLLWRYINFIFDAEKIKMQDVRVVMAYFTKTLLARMVSLQFLQSRWDEMNARFGDDGFVMREVIQEVTTYVNSEYEYENLQRLFKEKPLKLATKAAENALELIRANIEWKKLNYNRISDWLEHNAKNF